MKKKRSEVAARRECIACGEAIAAAAKLCVKCGTYQKSWKSRLQFIAAVAGVATLMSGGITWLTKTVPSIRRLVAWRSELRVVSFNSAHELTIMNVGDGPVALAHVALDIPGIDSRNFTLNVILKPGDVFTKTFTTTQHSKAYTLINHSTIQSWRHAVIKARGGFGENCVAAIVLSENDPTFLMYAEVDKDDPHELRYLNARMKLYFTDLKVGPREISVPVRGVLYARRDCVDGRAVLEQMNRSSP